MRKFNAWAWTAALTLLVAAPALADWEVGDPYKMHYPQLPDPVGWDVDITSKWIADDWLCTESGPVSDIHFWFSWKSDLIAEIAGVLVKIYNDVPAGTEGIPYSHPGEEVWSGSITQFTVRPAGIGEQGWYTPDQTSPEVIRPDHTNFFQMNMTGIQDPFWQEKGNIYWLALHMIPDPQAGDVRAGWKTSIEHWNDDAVYGVGGIPGWMELVDPLEPTQSLDMAFVVVPEPTTAVLLALGSLALALRRRCAV